MAVKRRSSTAAPRRSGARIADSGTDVKSRQPGGDVGSRPGVRPTSAELRHQMIAKAAYLRAERRGFAGGHDLQDWLDAEAEVEAQLRTR